MTTCNRCGGEIEIRYVQGRLIPIHVNGQSCSGSGGGNSTITTAKSKPFQNGSSYLNPNARCPLCGAIVFYYQSPTGGRVFFNNVGWPWEKHPCTDNPKSQSREVKQIVQEKSPNRTFRTKNGETLELYEIAYLKMEADRVRIKFRRLGSNMSFEILTTVYQLKTKWDVTPHDLRLAPSFAVRIDGDFRIIEFISVRKRLVDHMAFPRRFTKKN